MNVRTLGYIGAGLVVVGTVMPFATLPLRGDVTYLPEFGGPAVLVLLAGLASGLLVHRRRFSALWATGGVALVVSLWSMAGVLRGNAVLQDQMGGSADDPHFEVVGAAMAQSVQLQWGGPVMIAGALALLAAAWFARRPAGG